MSFLSFWILSIVISIVLFALRIWLIVKYNDHLRSHDKSEITRSCIFAIIAISLVPLLNLVIAILALAEIIFDFYDVWEWFNSSPFE